MLKDEWSCLGIYKMDNSFEFHKSTLEITQPSATFHIDKETHDVTPYCLLRFNFRVKINLKTTYLPAVCE